MSIVHQLDPELAALLDAEDARRSHTIQLIASESISSESVLAVLGSTLSWKTAEGSQQRRYHSGCEVVDQIESLAESRAATLFGSERVWTQPLSGSLANVIAYRAMRSYLKLGSNTMRVLAMGLDQGGHLSHGSKPSITRSLLGEVRDYVVDATSGLLDLAAIEAQVADFEPHLIICGASSYPRTVDFSGFGRIAKKFDALLLADISHLVGLVVAGVHPSPVPHAHLVTCSTYKAGGPRGGIIVAGERSEGRLHDAVTRAVFPGVQGTPDFSSIGAKAAFFAEAAGEEFRATQRSVIANATALATALAKRGYRLATGGTDNHMVLVDVATSLDVDGATAESALADVGIYVNRNLLPFDPRGASTTSAVRLGVNTVSRQGMGCTEMEEIASLIDDTLRHRDSAGIRARVAGLAGRFPNHVPAAPVPEHR